MTRLHLLHALKDGVVMLNLGRGSQPCGRYLLSFLTGSNEGSKGLRVLRVRPTPSRYQAPMDSTPLHLRWATSTACPKSFFFSRPPLQAIWPVLLCGGDDAPPSAHAQRQRCYAQTVNVGLNLCFSRSQPRRGLTAFTENKEGSQEFTVLLVRPTRFQPSIDYIP